jgi:hypothetical protein
MADLPDTPSVLFWKSAISPPRTIRLEPAAKPVKLSFTVSCSPLQVKRKFVARDVNAFAGTTAIPRHRASNQHALGSRATVVRYR